jgi:hypothetical protein
MTTLRLSLRCHGQFAGWMMSLGVVAALLGCGASEGPTPAVPESSAHAAPESSMGPVPVEVGTLATSAQPAAASVMLPVVTPVLPKVKPAPFELVGTSISATNAYALLKEADQSRLTVHEGDTIAGYTIAAIEPDRVIVRSPGSEQQLLVLLAATGNAPASTTRTNGVGSEPLASTALIADGINIDQSIPEDVTFGPTGSLPEGVKQMGH